MPGWPESLAVLRERGPLPAADLAAAIVERGRYAVPRSGKPLDAKTVSQRVSNPTYRSRFVRSEGRIGLADEFQIHVISIDGFTLDGVKRLEDKGVTDCIVGFRVPYIKGPDTEPLVAELLAKAAASLDVLTGASPWWFLLAVAIMTLTVVPMAERWRRLLEVELPLAVPAESLSTQRLACTLTMVPSGRAEM